MKGKRQKTMLPIFSSILILALACITIFASSASAETPQYGGVLKIIHTRSPLSFGYPPEIRGASYACAMPCLESLLRTDEMGRPIPMLVESWKVAPDKKSVMLYLRKGVKFHDGTDFNAQAVKYNMDAQKKSKRGGAFKMVKSVSVADDHTVKLDIIRYDSTVITDLTFSYGAIASPTAIEKNGIDWAKTHPVGTGPFQFVSYQRGDKIVYKKFAGYWNKGKPYLDGLEFLFIKDRMTSSAAFQAGEAHILSRITPKTANDMKQKGYQIGHVTSALRLLNPDNVSPDSIFKDKRVSAAVEYAINKKAIVDALGYGYWDVANQPCPNTRYGFNPDIKGRNYDPEMAKKLLTEAGYPNGFETEIIVSTQFSHKDAMVAIQRDLSKVGINVKLNLADPGKWANHKYKGWKNCLMYMLMGVDTNYVKGIYRQLGGHVKAYPNTIKPKAWDDSINNALSASNFETRKAMTQKAVRVAYDSVMMIPLWSTESLAAIDSKLHSDFYDYHHMQWKPEEAWFSK